MGGHDVLAADAGDGEEEELPGVLQPPDGGGRDPPPLGGSLAEPLAGADWNPDRP